MDELGRCSRGAILMISGFHSGLDLEMRGREVLEFTGGWEAHPSN